MRHDVCDVKGDDGHDVRQEQKDGVAGGAHAAGAGGGHKAEEESDLDSVESVGECVPLGCVSNFGGI